MKVDLANSAGRAVIPIAVAVVFALSRRYLPAAKRVSADEAIDSSGLVGYVTVATIFSLVVIVTASLLLLKYLNLWYSYLGPKPERVLLPNYIDWMFFPIFGGASLCWEVVLRIWSLFNPHQARAYAAWSDQKTGFSATKLLRWMAVLIALPVGVIELLLVPVHDSFYADHIAIGRMAHLAPEIHPYSSVTTFAVIDGIVGTDGKFSKEPTILLRFTDGTEWRSWATREDYSIDESLVRHLANHIHREPEHLLMEPPH